MTVAREGRSDGGREMIAAEFLWTITARAMNSTDHKVMASIHSTPTGLTAHECDYRGKTVYLTLITTPGNALYCLSQSSGFV